MKPVNLNQRDKFAVIMASYGIGVEESLNIWSVLEENYKTDEFGGVVHLQSQDMVIWLGDGGYVTVYTRVGKEFCQNRGIVADIVLGEVFDWMDDESDLRDHLIEYIRDSRKRDSSSQQPAPIPQDLLHLFTFAELSDYVDCDSYDLGVACRIKVIDED